MKRVIWFCLFLLLGVPASGQHRGGFGAGPSRGGVVSAGLGHGRFRGGVVLGGFGFRSQGFINLGIPPVGPIPPLGVNSSFFGLDRRFGFRHHFFPSTDFFPYAFPLFAGGYDYGYPPGPNVIVIQQPAPQVIVQQVPREVVRPEIRNYKEAPPAAVTVPPAATGEGATFVIALNDGSVRAASAVWAQDRVLHYVDKDDIHHQVPMRSVNRELTRKLNRERKLELWLPAAE